MADAEDEMLGGTSKRRTLHQFTDVYCCMDNSGFIQPFSRIFKSDFGTSEIGAPSEERLSMGVLCMCASTYVPVSV